MSRPLNDVATLNPLQRMSRQLNDVATSSLCFCCLDYWMMSRPPFLCSGCRDLLSFSSSIHGCLTWGFCHAQLVLPSITLQLQLEFCRHDLNMNFHCCKGFTTSVPLILLCHAPNPGPTRLADPNRFSGRETQDWDSLT